MLTFTVLKHVLTETFLERTMIVQFPKQHCSSSKAQKNQRLIFGNHTTNVFFVHKIFGQLKHCFTLNLLNIPFRNTVVSKANYFFYHLKIHGCKLSFVGFTLLEAQPCFVNAFSSCNKHYSIIVDSNCTLEPLISQSLFTRGK